MSSPNRKFRHGGARPGAGRKRKRGSGPRHRRRPDFPSDSPLHVSVRVEKRCWNLRTKRAYTRLRDAFACALGRFSTKLIEFSIQGNHFHFIVESMNRVELGRAMKGLM